MQRNGTTIFTLTFATIFKKEVQKYGPLSFKGTIVLEVQGEIQANLSHTIGDFDHQAKMPFGPLCAEVLTEEEMGLKEEVKQLTEMKSKCLLGMVTQEKSQKLGEFAPQEEINVC